MTYRLLWCNECTGFVIHLVEDKKEAQIQNVTCIVCGHITTNKIINKRVKVELNYYDQYIRKNGDSGLK